MAHNTWLEKENEFQGFQSDMTVQGVFDVLGRFEDDYKEHKKLFIGQHHNWNYVHTDVQEDEYKAEAKFEEIFTAAKEFLVNLFESHRKEKIKRKEDEKQQEVGKQQDDNREFRNFLYASVEKEYKPIVDGFLTCINL
jgi:hypothetical protein